MPRHARIVVPDVPVHLIQRGHNRHACFFHERDYEYYLHWLEYLSRQAECDIHAYVLMTNHVHLAITPHDSHGLAHLMKALNQRYVCHMNKCYNRTGSLWEGRFKSCLILQQSYFLTCMRYIEQNPVRAGMVEHPRDYQWSSYRANAEGADNTLVVPHGLYLALNADEIERRGIYRRFLAAMADEASTNALRHATNANHVLGDAGSFEQMARRLPPGQHGRPKKLQK